MPAQNYSERNQAYLRCCLIRSCPHASQSLSFEKRFLENPFTARCEPDIQSFMEDLKPLDLQAAKRMVEMLGEQIGLKAMAKAR